MLTSNQLTLLLILCGVTQDNKTAKCLQVTFEELMRKCHNGLTKSYIEHLEVNM